jgi:hypothetical protein
MAASTSTTQPNILDQFLANKHGRRRRPDQLDPPTVQIFKPPAMVNPDLYPKPIPFRGAPTRSSE